MNHEPHPSVDPELFIKALQLETGSADPLSEDDIIAMSNDIEIDNDNEFRSYVSQQLQEGASARSIFENAEVAEEFNQLLNESSEEFSEHTLAMNTELKDLFEADDEDENRGEH